MLISGLILLGFLPGFGLRIRHYILALLANTWLFNKRKSAMFWSVLLGLLLEWNSQVGFYSIIETQRALLGSAGDLVKPPIFDIPAAPKDQNFRSV